MKMAASGVETPTQKKRRERLERKQKMAQIMALENDINPGEEQIKINYSDQNMGNLLKEFIFTMDILLIIVAFILFDNSK